MAKIVSLGSALQDIFLIDDQAFIGCGHSHEEKSLKIISAKEIEERKLAEQTAGARKLPKNSMKFVPVGELFKNLTIGTKVGVKNIWFDVGGGATNSAVTFARHGHEAVFVGKIGHDIAGEAVLDCLDREGIDSSYITYTRRKATGCSIILTDQNTGERTILTHRGASEDFDNLDEKILDKIRPDWMYITTLHGDFNTCERFFVRAKELGVKIMMNPGSPPKNRVAKALRLMKYVDILLVNKREAGIYVPGTVLPELMSHLRNYVPTVIITAGQMGAMASSPEETYRMGIYEDLKVVDTTGAGDAFGSGFLAHYAAGKSFRQSLIFGAANSTSVVTKLGAKAGILTGKEKLHPMVIQRV
ncbi:MAG: carbohydrate kinase family protein [Candidatus Saccharibacteria bacterium]|nr:carbohydrate kinase family protein [Candidatus Saccharibacteria bacterium]